MALPATLLLDVRTAIRSRRDRASPPPSHDDQRDHVRERPEERRPRGVLPVRSGQPEREGLREPEDEAGGKRAERPPPTEDDGGQRDEAAAGGQVLVERMRDSVREVHAAETRERTGEDDRGVPNRIPG